MLRIFVFTDEEISEKGLREVLGAAGGMRLVASCRSANALVEAARNARADVLLLDFDCDVSLRAIIGLRHRLPDCRIVLWIRNISTELAYQAVEHGVSGILRKSLPAATLVKCLRAVSEGGYWFEEDLRASLMGVRPVNLTPREAQLVNLLSQGLRNKEAAAALGISEGTVKVYLSRLFRKVDVKDRFELAIYGLKNLAASETPLSRDVASETAALKKTAAKAGVLHSLVVGRSSVKRASAGPSTEPPPLAN